MGVDGYVLPYTPNQAPQPLFQPPHFLGKLQKNFVVLPGSKVSRPPAFAAYPVPGKPQNCFSALPRNWVRLPPTWEAYPGGTLARRGQITSCTPYTQILRIVGKSVTLAAHGHRRYHRLH